jgi:hypothetical protein
MRATQVGSAGSFQILAVMAGLVPAIQTLTE